MRFIIGFTGAFIGCSLEGSIVTTRSQENSRFYGNPSISAEDILLGSLPTPPAAAILNHALSNLFEKVERQPPSFGFTLFS
jgi:lipid-binding SYLF domain-containing protein